MKTNLKLLVWALGVMLSLSCKKDKNATKEPASSKAVPVALGTPNGAAVQKTIGPAGGTIEMPGSAIVLNIPAGAVDAATIFSIQPITNTLGQMGIGNSYRLLPENVSFKKDIEIVFNYTEDQLIGTSGEFMSAAYQDAKGYWHAPSKATTEQYNFTVKVKTKHFSDWILTHKVVMINKGKGTLEKNETADFQVLMQSFEETIDDDDLLGPVIQVTEANVVSWELTGDGSIGNGKSVSQKYTAPSTIKQRGIATISVTLKDVWKKILDPLPGQPTESWVFYEIKLMPDEYFIWKQNGEEFEGSQRLQATSLGNGQIVINTEAPHKETSVFLSISGNYPGKHLFTAEPKDGSSLGVVGYLNFLFTSRYTCENKNKSTDGYVTITSTGEKPGDYVIGELAGNFANGNGCSPEVSFVTGKFKIMLQK
ncbi:hypothetical protein DBR11_23980 [Pedobacter sp. HMWF019]|uniref:hypothetical protein n=1 Tax=Pedobacter sp. HMWF019 TaxID=2056856 RepID=UPI000D373E62|nr:hypothetical protein [Pedobacter sp. HMWF019]PTS94167.1 hypothetical protein DBR11_23980 [Pedobacter sp. HMWF019]